ncbi:MAG: Cys-tRNA(Pro) deacylase [Corynebacterium sp.]|uniref:Cys-tRNA(Pro) deacylase n=1 Tax=Corynebacterium sp. TaxID=1720 RepID=UPI0026DB1133|nr:Cys-tRNA(Pro) deacylase [Corynebacterium sp.]MDO4761236.1 Cys-tRNA(Pro) deacylase [Corynebacterium sp.]
MAKKKVHAATPALKVLEESQTRYVTHCFSAGTSHFGQEAAEALQISPERVFKTLMVDLTAGVGPKRKLAVACLPVAYQLSLKKAAAALGVPKVTMADPHDASKSSGYIPGGISPLGQKTPVPTVLDESAQLFDTIFVSGGKRGLDVELSADDLVHLTNAEVADIAAI